MFVCLFVCFYELSICCDCVVVNVKLDLSHLSNFLDVCEYLMYPPRLREHCTKADGEAKRQQTETRLQDKLILTDN